MHDIRKAAITVCLFLFAAYTATAQEFSFKPQVLQAYQQVLNLKPEAGRELIANGSSTEELYVVALSEAMELLLTEDAEKFSLWETRFEKRADRKANGVAVDLFFKAEIHLHWSFVYLKFGHEFDAALQLRKAYLITKELRKKHPHYKPILKTSGLLNVMIGSVPDKYDWVLDMLDMHGDVTLGLKELEELKNMNHSLSLEATLWHAFILGFVLQQPQAGMDELEKLPSFRQNMTAMFLAANLYIKNSTSEKALTLLNEMGNEISSETFPYLAYLKGEILLQKGNYGLSIDSYDEFLRFYHGQNYLKDAYYKKGICHWLENHKNEALQLFDIARKTGNETTEADKYAARALLESEPPPNSLIKLRYFTDGGYYQEALSHVSSMGPRDFTTLKDQVEFQYRKARLYHKLGDVPRAILMYQSTLEQSGDSEWYFAPNACLQLGYIAVQENRIKEAREFFQKALSYKKHEYKNSIDSKARSALAQLKERR
jgi:tetratricopeptide (TPR) repeat protein